MNGNAVVIRGWNQEKGRYDVAPPDDLASVKAIKADNLTPIPEATIESLEVAWEFAMALREAYAAPAAAEKLAALKASCPDMAGYMAKLRYVVLPLQVPVLERFGFRPDFVGQNHMQRAFGIYEMMSPELLQFNKGVEELLGLPSR